MHRLGDVLDLLQAGVGEGGRDAVADMLAHRRRNADPAGLGQRLQPRRDIDAVAEQIPVAWTMTSPTMDADAEQHAAVGRKILVLLGDRALHGDRADETVDGARKLGEQRVAGGVGNAAAMLGQQRLDDRAARGQAAQRRILVGAHQPAVLGDVGGENRRQAALDMARHHDDVASEAAAGFAPGSALGSVPGSATGRVRVRASGNGPNPPRVRRLQLRPEARGAASPVAIASPRRPREPEIGKRKPRRNTP